MGHGFTFPFVRLIAGSQIVTAAYVHYPTVSTDMVRRVTEELLGVESGHAASRGWRKGVKLVYVVHLHIHDIRETL
jgi:alpha-1,2-mannosyltransferase